MRISRQAPRCATGLIRTIMLAAAVCFAAPANAQQADTERARPTGSLDDATVFVSPGHGWMWNANAGRWVTQRGVTHRLIEDHSNAEAVLQYLVPYLWNAGAKVHTTRERDLQTSMVIVQAGGEGYTEIGEWKTEQAEGAYGGEQRVAATIKAKELLPADTDKVAAAAFTPEIPEDGHYAVYAWYRPALAGRTATDASFIITHSGGTTVWRQNQSHNTRTWTYLGTFHFEKGSDPGKGSVVLTNAGSRSGSYVVANAVRFGGGMGDMPGAEDGPVSGKPRWKESGLYYSQFMGYNPETDTRRFNTVSAMPRLSEWEAEPWEKGRSIYIGWHTNAHTGQARGLFSFVYGPDEWGTLERFTGYPGGVELVKSVHEQIIGAVHQTWDPEWRDGRQVTRWLGETNPTNNNKMPAALFEMGFHDNVDDAGYILDPRFRRLVARAVYQGTVKYYRDNVKGFEKAKFLPEPPTGFRVTATGEGVQLAWEAPPHGDGDGPLGDAATGYRVYRSRNGKGFDNGFAVKDTRHTFTNIAAGETVYFRVTATNEGGESLPSEVLAVRLEQASPRVLFVAGFDRLDRGLNLDVNGVERGILSKMNTYDYVIQHAEALAANGHAIESASNEAVESGAVKLADYDVVIWQLGQEKGETEAFSEAEQRLLREYVRAGGALFVSGSDAAEDLHRTPEGRAFLREVLRASLRSHDAGAREASSPAGVAGAAPSIFAGIAPVAFHDAGGRTYPVQTPDALDVADGGVAALLYSGEDAGIAAMQHAGSGKVVYLGFPFETVEDAAVRREVMRRAMEFLRP